MVFKTIVLTYLLAVVVSVQGDGGFDWGSGCEGGSGSFETELTTQGAIIDVGEIPASKWNVKIRLFSAADVDVQLYDSSATSVFPEGAAIIAYCESTGCNKGAMGNNDGTAESTTYGGMPVSYSGYFGVDGQPGREWISVDGEVKVPLVMKAFAFAAGTARVEYEWDRVQTGCCLGVETCTGSFSADVAEGAAVNIGEIPRGKKFLNVRLFAATDVDVQLFDTEDTGRFDEGQAIIAYCEPDGCNKGAMGNNDGSAESTVYKNVTYEYSGYSGVEGEPGNEYVRIMGKTNTAVFMKAFGYAAGLARVEYSYFEDVASAVVLPSVSFLGEQNRREHHTSMFTGVPASVLIVRRAGVVNFLVYNPTGVAASQVNASLVGSVTGVDGDESASTPQAHPAAFTVAQAGSNEVRISLDLAADAPIGSYTLTVAVEPGARGGTSVSKSITLMVLLNPYKTADACYISSSNRAEYVENPVGLIWQGLSDENEGQLFQYEQFKYETLRVAMRGLRRMPVATRGDLVRLARHVTYFVGADLCYGKWGEGSYTSGRPSGGHRCSQSTGPDAARCFGPDHWSNMSTLFHMHTHVNGQVPVQYCQCFVYAAVTTAVGRALGLPPV